MTREKDDLELDIDLEENTGKDIVAEVWKFFSSMKLGLFLLLIISVASIAGTLMKPDPQTGELPYNLYGSYWYRGLLGLLCLNLLVCSLNRWKLITKAMGEPRIVVSENFLKKLKNYTLVKDKTDASTLEEVLKESLAAKGYRVFIEEKNDKTIIAADKGRFGVLGSFITHISFVIITLGTIYGNIGGFETYFNAAQGQVVDIISLPDVQNFSPEDNFQIRIDKAWQEYGANGQVSDYFSELTVMQNGQEVKSKKIEVNDPLVHNGVKFYQSSMGPVVEATMKYTDKEGKETSQVIAEGGAVNIPGTDLTVVFSRFNPDYDPNNPMQPRSNQPNNPAVLYELHRGQVMVDRNFTILEKDVKFEQGSISFGNLQQGYFTGLSVRKDPGVPIVWLGCGIMILGMLISLFWQHRKIWAIVTESKGLTTIEMGGITEKNKLGLENDFNAVVDSLKA
ncbi:MAG: cytochrome c biogenesis protein ResB [Clostridia bacterium]|nr:cytochrome c biogenesis protein ResB [Clostridia bacterium]